MPTKTANHDPDKKKKKGRQTNLPLSRQRARWICPTKEISFSHTLSPECFVLSTWKRIPSESPGQQAQICIIFLLQLSASRRHSHMNKQTCTWLYCVIYIRQPSSVRTRPLSSRSRTPLPSSPADDCLFHDVFFLTCRALLETLRSLSRRGTLAGKRQCEAWRSFEWPLAL